MDRVAVILLQGSSKFPIMFSVSIGHRFRIRSLSVFRTKTVTMLSALVSVALATGFPAMAANAAPVNQGDAIFRVGSKTGCTVGYVDAVNDRLFTAGHCGPNGSQWERRQDTAFRVGEMRTNYAPGSLVGDFAFIEVADSATLGKNFPHAEKPVESLTLGDEICVYSRKLSVSSCDRVTAVDGDTVFAGHGLRVVSGDSGGPAWNDNGFIGVISGSRIDPASQEVINVRITRVDPRGVGPTKRVHQGDGDRKSLSSLSSMSSSSILAR